MTTMESWIRAYFLLLFAHTVNIVSSEEIVLCSFSERNEDIICPEGAVINILSAMQYHAVELPSCDLSELTEGACKQKMPYFGCHGERKCTVIPYTVRNWMRDCRDLGNLLHINYTCYIIPRLPTQEIVVCSFSESDRDIACPEGAVIDVHKAVHYRIWDQSECRLPYYSCSQDLQLFSCHEQQQCTVTRDMAAGWISKCSYYGNLIHIVYSCYPVQENSTLWLPPYPQNGRQRFGNMVDIFSSNRPHQLLDFRQDGDVMLSCVVCPLGEQRSTLWELKTVDMVSSENCQEIIEWNINGKRSHICSTPTGVHQRAQLSFTSPNNNMTMTYSYYYPGQTYAPGKFWIHVTSLTGEDLYLTTHCKTVPPPQITTPYVPYNLWSTTRRQFPYTRPDIRKSTTTPRNRRRNNGDDDDDDDHSYLLATVLWNLGYTLVGVVYLTVLISICCLCSRKCIKNKRKIETKGNEQGEEKAEEEKEKNNETDDKVDDINEARPSDEIKQELSSLYT